MTVRRLKRQSAWAIFAIPVLLGVATAVGLVAGLLGDGAYDLVAAVGLVLPVLVIVGHLLRR